MNIKKNVLKFVNIQNVQISYNNELYNIIYDSKNDLIIIQKNNSNLKFKIKLDNLNYIYQIDENDFILSKRGKNYDGTFEHIGFVDGVLSTKFYQKYEINTYMQSNIAPNIYLLSIDKNKYLLYNSKTRKTRVINNKALFEIFEFKNQKKAIKITEEIRYKNIFDTLYYAIDPDNFKYIGKIYSKLQNKCIGIYQKNQIHPVIKDTYDNRIVMTYLNKIYKPMISLCEKKSNSYQKKYK